MLDRTTHETTLGTDGGRRVLPLLQSKLRPPSPTQYFVPRARISALLDAASAHPLTVVVAPAGSGKSQAVASWAATSGASVAWLSLDGLDEDPVELWLGLIAALDQVAPASGSAARDLVVRGAPIGDVVRALLDSLETAIDQLRVLVIDDVHLVTNPEAVGSLALFVQNLPDLLHMILIGRTDPQLPLDRMRVRGQLGEIRFNDLRLSTTEARTVLSALASELTEEELDSAVTNTSGWAAGVQLTALAARSATAIANGAWSESVDMLTDDYVWREVLAAGDPDSVEVMLQVSVVDRVNAELATAVTGRADARDLLYRAEAQALFVQRLGADGWFRIHALVREALRRELVRQNRHRTMHERAAKWFEDAGETVSALEQWLLAERPLEALRLVSRRSTELYDRGREAVITRTIEAIPRREVATDVGALVDYAVSLILVSRPRFLAAVEDAAWHAERAAEVIPGQIDALRSIALVMEGNWQEGHTRALRAIDELGERWWNDPAGRFAWNTAARGVALSESWDEMNDFVNDATIAMRRDPERVLSFEGVRALGEAMAGRPVEALRLVAGVQHAASKMSILRAETAIAEAIARREIGDRNRASDLLQAIAEQPPDPRLYCTIAAILGLAATGLDNGDIEAASEWLARAETVVAEERGGTELREWLHRVETQVAIEAGHADRARSAAASITDDFWGPASRARVHLALGDAAAAQRELSVAMPRCVRHRVTWGLLNARASESPTEARQYVADALELAGSNLLLQTVVSEGRDLMELIERAALQVSNEWLDRVREAATQRRVPEGVAPRSGMVEVLTDRERDVLRLLPSRLTVKEMAGELYISVNTLKFHLKVIYRKLGVSSRKEAAAIARSMTSIRSHSSQSS